MQRIVLPAQINPPTLRKDGSASLRFETREITPEEYMIIMGFRNTEGWLCFQPNNDGFELPEEKSSLGGKTQGQRLRATMFVWYKQEFESGKYLGTFEAFYHERMEKIINTVKGKLEDK